MDLHERVAKLERANRQWKLLVAALFAVCPVLVFVSGMSSKATGENDIVDEVRTRKLSVCDAEGNAVSTFEPQLLVMADPNTNISLRLTPTLITMRGVMDAAASAAAQKFWAPPFETEMTAAELKALKRSRRRPVYVKIGIESWYSGTISLFNKDHHEVATLQGDQKHQGVMILSDENGRRRHSLVAE